MEKKRSWTCEEVLSLIKCFKNFPNLWDNSHIYYKSKIKKQNAYKEMAAVFQTTPAEVDRKIKNVISQYKRERRYYKKLKKSGAVGSFVAKWFGYQAMSFMHDEIHGRGRDGWLEYQTIDSGDAESLSDIHSHMCETLNRGEADSPAMLCKVDVGYKTEAEQKVIMNSDKSHLTRPENEVKHKNKHESNVFPTLKSLFQSRNVLLQHDECDVFGEMVAQNLKLLKTEYAKITTQNRINNLLYEARLGHFDRPQSVAAHNTSAFMTTRDQSTASLKTNDNLDDF